MRHPVVFVGLVALVVGCDSVASDGPDSIAGSWGGVATTLSVNHDSTFWRYECLSGIVPVSIRLGPDGSFVAQGTMAGLSLGQPMRLYGAVQADTMHLYFQTQDANGVWSAPGGSLLIGGHAATEPLDIVCPG